jgi:hypothetical protein
VAQGGDFWRGAEVSFALSTLSYAAHEMRAQAWLDAQNPEGNNTSGKSAGFRGDGRKLAGQWCFATGICKEAPFGGAQGGPGKLFGIAYKPGSMSDLVLEAYAGPHDWLDNLWFADHGYLKQLTGFTNVVGTAYAGLNLVVATPFVAASVIPTGAYGGL